MPPKEDAGATVTMDGRLTFLSRKKGIKLADGPSPLYLRLIEVLSSEKKDSEGLPENYLRYSEELPPPSEYFPHH